MKRAILISLVLTLFLSGCGKREDGTETVSNADVPTLESVAVSAAEQKAAYYREKAAVLEKELLELKATLYAERAEYEARIDALEAAVNADAAEALFTYTVEGGRATVTGYLGESAVVVIPSTLGGVPVCAIADRAFENCTELTRVTVGEGIEHLGWFAFSGCIGLESVTLPASLSKIEYGAFLNCPATLVVHCPAGSYAEQYAESYGFAVR